MRSNIKFTCIVDTVYTLLLYLLYQSYGNVQRTQFFVGDTITDEMAAALPHCVKLSSKKEDYEGKEKLRRIRWEFFWKYHRKIWRTKLYAEDHLQFSPQLICGQKYTLLEDSPGFITVFKDNTVFRQNVPDDLKTRLWLKVYYGQIYGHIFGTHEQCVNRILTSEDDANSPMVVGRKFELVDLALLWRNADNPQKEFIKKVYGITEELWRNLMSADTVFFTQPFINDCGLTEYEHKAIILPYYERWKDSGFVIKPHPRDKFDYKCHFPQAKLFESKAPSQLISLLGVTFRRAITVSSTAVSSLPKETELIWIGNSINEKILRIQGEVECTRR